jgi:hypothetical protein
MEYNHSKAFYKQIVHAYVGGKAKRFSCNFSDVTTDRVHAIIRSWDKMHTATSQIHLCNVELPREELHLYMYGPEPDSFNAMIELYKSLNILIHTFREIDGTISIYCHNTEREVFSMPLSLGSL